MSLRLHAPDYASLTSAERFLALVPDRFKQDVQKLSPAKGRKPWSEDARLMGFSPHCEQGFTYSASINRVALQTATVQPVSNRSSLSG
jgi:hypothetical protein